MPPKRDNSGTRNGTTAVIMTLKDLKKMKAKERSKADFNQIFIDHYKEDYPDETNDAKIKKILESVLKDYDWGIGQKLGTITDAKKIANTSNHENYAKILEAHEAKRQEKLRVLQQIENDKKKIENDKKIEKVNQIKEKIIGRRKDLKKKEEIVNAVGQGNELVKNIRTRQEAFALLWEYAEKKKKLNADEKDALKQAIEFVENHRESLTQEQKAEFRNIASRALHSKADAEDKQKAREEHEKDVATYNRTPSSIRGAPPNPRRSNVVPIEPDEPEKDHKEETEFKKIDRKNVEDIDNTKKVEKSDLNTHVKPTVHLSDIKKQLAKHRSRLKFSHDHIKYHRLGKSVSKAGHDMFA